MIAPPAIMGRNGHVVRFGLSLALSACGALRQMDTTLTFTSDSLQVHPASSTFCDSLNSWRGS